MKRLVSISFFLLLVTSLSAQPQKFSTILYGVAYYHEYMPYERLETDVKLMQDAGISVVRLGESSWSLFEPQEGVFEFAWMDRIIDRMHKAGIKVILGTPTYSIPAWLAKKYLPISSLPPRKILLLSREGKPSKGTLPKQALPIV